MPASTLKDYFIQIVENNTARDHLDGEHFRMFFTTVPKVSGDTAKPNYMEWQVPTSTEGSRFWLYTQTRTISLETKFVAYDNAQRDVIDRVRWCRGLMYPLTTTLGDPHNRPPICLVVCSKWLQFMGICSSVSVTYNMDALVPDIPQDRGPQKVVLSRADGSTYSVTDWGDEGPDLSASYQNTYANRVTGSYPLEATVSMQFTQLHRENPAIALRDQIADIKTASAQDLRATTSRENARAVLSWTIRDVQIGKDEKLG